MSIPANFNPEEAENLEDIEKQFAVKAVEHAETYWTLVRKFGPDKIKLTGCDNEIYDDFVATFPEVLQDMNNVKHINENVLKNKENKKKWFDFSKKYEDKVSDYNFGCMLRIDSDKPYTYENTIFSFRLQFDAFEIFRNRHGMNDWAKGTSE